MHRRRPQRALRCPHAGGPGVATPGAGALEARVLVIENRPELCTRGRGVTARPALLPVYGAVLLAARRTVHLHRVRPAAPPLPGVLLARTASEPPASYRGGVYTLGSSCVHLGVRPYHAAGQRRRVSRACRHNPAGVAVRARRRQERHCRETRATSGWI